MSKKTKLFMLPSLNRMHRIYIAATMNYGLGSDNPEEFAYYKKIRKEMNDMKKYQKKRDTLQLANQEWINESQYFFINCWDSYDYWSAFDDDS